MSNKTKLNGLRPSESYFLKERLQTLSVPFSFVCAILFNVKTGKGGRSADQHTWGSVVNTSLAKTLKN